MKKQSHAIFSTNERIFLYQILFLFFSLRSFLRYNVESSEMERYTLKGEKNEEKSVHKKKVKKKNQLSLKKSEEKNAKTIQTELSISSHSTFKLSFTFEDI